MDFLKYLKQYWFYIAIFFYIVIGGYVLTVAYQQPLVGIQIQQQDDSWTIESIWAEEWAKEQGIAVGDLLLLVNEEPIKAGTTYISTATQLQVLQHTEVKDITVSNAHLPYMFYMHFVIPLIYFIITLLTACYLYRYKQNQLLPMLILFLLAVSLAYISAGASSRGNPIGSVTISTTMLLGISILVHFLRNYFALLRVRWPYTKNLMFIYSFPIAIFCISIRAIWSNPFSTFAGLGTLVFFSTGLLTVFGILLYGYMISKRLQLKFLIYSCILPILPFVFLFVVPEVLFQRPLVSSEILAVFLLFIPFSFIFTQLTERLFGLQYHLSRIRYYGNISVITATVLTTIITVIWRDVFDVQDALILFCLTLILTFILLYVKEKVDFQQRKLLVTTDGRSIHGLYAVIQRIGKARSEVQLTDIVLKEVKEKLGFEALSIYTMPAQQISVMPFEVTKRGPFYELLLHRNVDQQYILSIGSQDEKIQLQHEEIIWLEMIALYCDTFLHTLKQVEELVQEMSLQQRSIPWLDKLIWQFVEKEKVILAHELHDTILQEQLFLARELDLEQGELSEQKIETIRDQLLEVSYELREYCENLNPPLLDTLGLQAALKKFTQKMKMRADFILQERIEPLSLTDTTYPLMIYRLVQELLNNAYKHSQAKHVTLEVLAIPGGVEIHYKDDGIGLNIDNLDESDSMGLNGMRERVRAFNGTMHISSTEAEGLSILISMKDVML
ncbi:ATP-binding protein [Lysinibacillus sp. KU-BSD001]|uniref:sensor histidine kinase n=1 Tax=Lysinibacillus sp. KU-BSD001 TaxID=3141328 RepID=UPI0036EC9A4F